MNVTPDAANAQHLRVLDRLRQEKERLSSELSAFRRLAADRSLTAAESRSWKAVRTAWQEVSAELTRELDAVAPRSSGDRRSGTDRRLADRRVTEASIADSERRSGLQRRRRERRKTTDRRAQPSDDAD